MSDEHGGHSHGTRPGVAAGEGSDYYARRAAAIQELLVEKGVCTPEEIRRKTDEVEARSPADGARVVARAWADPAFKARLLADTEAALGELGYSLPQTTPKLAVVENTARVHHLVVCTLCSCYPRALLGRPPDWYKSFAYRSRAVVDPRGVMREFGLEVDASVEVRVLDSTADLRYLVLPRRPEGAEGLTEAELAKLVTRDCMIGVSSPRAPQPAAAAD